MHGLPHTVSDGTAHPSRGEGERFPAKARNRENPRKCARKSRDAQTAANAACARSISSAPTGLRVVIISTNTSKRYAESCGPGLASG